MRQNSICQMCIQNQFLNLYIQQQINNIPLKKFMFQYPQSTRSNYSKLSIDKACQNIPPYQNRSSSRKPQIEPIRYNQKFYPTRESNIPESAFKNQSFNQSNTKSIRQPFTPINDNYINQFKSSNNQLRYDEKNLTERYGTKTQQISTFRPSNTGVSKQDELLRKLELYEQKYQVDTKNKPLRDTSFNVDRYQTKPLANNEIYRKKIQMKPGFENYDREVNKVKINQDSYNYNRYDKAQDKKYSNDWQRNKTKGNQQYYKQNVGFTNTYQNGRNKESQGNEYNYRQYNNETDKRNVDSLITNLQRKYGKQEIKIVQSGEFEPSRKYRNQYTDKSYLREEKQPKLNKQRQSSKFSKDTQQQKFYAQRNERKELLRQKSEQLKLKMNSPSPLKKDNQLGGIKSEKSIQDNPQQIPKIQRGNQKIDQSYKQDKYDKSYDRFDTQIQRASNPSDRYDRRQRYEQKNVGQRQERYIPTDRYDRPQRAERQYLYQRSDQNSIYKQTEKSQKNIENRNKQSQIKIIDDKKTPIKSNNIKCNNQEKDISCKKNEIQGKKLQFEQDTYRKIETINELNNKINQRIKHILSNFNQQI